MKNWSAKKIGVVVGIVLALILIGIIVGLYMLGGKDQAPLERFRDISIVFSQLLMLIVVILLAAITAALVFLIMKIKDNVLPLLDEGLGILRELKGSAQRVHGTTDAITEEAIKPFMTAAGQVAKIRKMGQIVSGKNKGIADPPTFKAEPRKK